MKGRAELRSLLGFVVVAGAATLACSPTATMQYCPTVEPATGGSVVGTWSLSGAGSAHCDQPYDRVSSTDWCSQLLFDTSGIRTLMLGHPAMELKTATVTFTDDANGTNPAATQGSFTSMLHFESVLEDKVPDSTGMRFDHVFFPYACLTAGGHTPTPTCADLTAAWGGFLADQSQADQSYRLLPLSQFPNYPPGTQPHAYYVTNDCNDDTVRGGCDCKYTVQLDAPDTGTWGVDGTTLSLYSASSAPAYVNDFSAGGGQLGLSGHGGLDLFGQQGLRLVVLNKK